MAMEDRPLSCPTKPRSDLRNKRDGNSSVCRIRKDEK